MAKSKPMNQDLSGLVSGIINKMSPMSIGWNYGVVLSQANPGDPNIIHPFMRYPYIDPETGEGELLVPEKFAKTTLNHDGTKTVTKVTKGCRANIIMSSDGLRVESIEALEDEDGNVTILNDKNGSYFAFAFMSSDGKTYHKETFNFNTIGYDYLSKFLKGSEISPAHVTDWSLVGSNESEYFGKKYDIFIRKKGNGFTQIQAIFPHTGQIRANPGGDSGTTIAELAGTTTQQLLQRLDRQ